MSNPDLYAILNLEEAESFGQVESENESRCHEHVQAKSGLSTFAVAESSLRSFTFAKRNHQMPTVQVRKFET